MNFTCKPFFSHPACLISLPVLPQEQGWLPYWQLVVATTALFNTVQNFLTLKLTRRIYSRSPDAVNALQARTFAIWTLTSAVVRAYAAYHIHEKSYVYFFVRDVAAHASTVSTTSPCSRISSRSAISPQNSSSSVPQDSMLLWFLLSLSLVSFIPSCSYPPHLTNPQLARSFGCLPSMTTTSATRGGASCSRPLSPKYSDSSPSWLDMCQ